MSDAYTVVELAGYVGENDRRSFPTYREACAWMAKHYGADEREELHVDIRLDTAAGEQTYDFG